MVLGQGFMYSVASRLQNCRNSDKCIYQPHKWEASTPIHLQKMRTGFIFQQPMWPFFCFVVVVVGSLIGIIHVTFLIGQLHIAGPIVTIVIGKATIFHIRLELGVERTNMKQTLLDFSFSLSKKQK